jgi:hypothetical protein
VSRGGIYIHDKLAGMTTGQLAAAVRLVRDLANSGVCEPDELRMLWRIADRIDAAVASKRSQS